MERVRVDYVQNQPFVVPGERLQNKAQRYYFTGTMQLAPGEIFVSPLDLNVEQDRVETPIKPTLRLAMPVQDAAGQARGIVIANYFGRYLLDRFSEVTEAGDSVDRVNLLNRDGYWLKAPQSADEWGFMFGRKEHFGTRFPGGLDADCRGRARTVRGCPRLVVVQDRAPAGCGHGFRHRVAAAGFRRLGAARR